MGTVRGKAAGRSLVGGDPARFPDQPEEKVRQCIRRLEGLQSEKPSIRREEYDVFNADVDHLRPHTSRHGDRKSQMVHDDSSRILLRYRG